jgi:hypothetical protein
MKKITSIFLYSCTAMGIVLSIGLSSCSKDDDKEPEAKAQLSFAVGEMTVNEADGTAEIEIVLDKAVSEDIVVEYELDGTAQDAETATDETDLPDYEIADDDHGEVEIAKGETTGTITITLYTDFAVEASETIEISIVDVDSDLVEITRDDEVEITLEQEQDGALIYLEWDYEAHPSVDLDLFVRVAALGGNVAATNVVWGSVNGKPEVIFIPASFNNALFGLSYTYYEGTADPLDFTATFVDVVDGTLEDVVDRDLYEGTYTLANINKWTSLATTKVVQTFEIVSGEFTNFSEIEEATTGSRVDNSPDNLSPVVTKQTTRFNNTKNLESLFKSKRIN